MNKKWQAKIYFTWQKYFRLAGLFFPSILRALLFATDANPLRKE
jgi:hypothetical protein